LFTASVILKLIQNTDIRDFSVSSNDENFGAFDDVVFETESLRGSRQIQAVQLKHANKDKILTKSALEGERGDFSIAKYYEEFKKLDCGGDPSVQFVLLTNRRFDLREGESIKLKHEDVEVKMFKVQPDPLVNTSTKGFCYKFVVEKAQHREFFDNFVLYTDQMNIDKIKKNISTRFETMFTCDKISFKDFMEFINEWSIREGKKPKLDTILTKRVITLCLLSPFIVPFMFDQDGTVDANSKLLREAIFHFNVTVFNSDSCDRLKRIYSDAIDEIDNNNDEIRKIGIKYQIVPTYSSVVDDLTDLEKTKLLWLIGKFPLIVSASPRVYKAIHLCQNRKYIILGNEDLACNFQNLSDLDAESEIYENILDNFQCSLQGKRKISLRNLIEDNENMKAVITTNELLQMLDESFSIGGPRESLPVPYVNRLISRNIVDFKFLQELRRDTLVAISCREQFDQIKEHINNFNIKRTEDCPVREDEDWVDPSMGNFFTDGSMGKSYVTIYVNDHEFSSSEFSELCEKHPDQKKYHHFKVIEGKLEWVQSIGDISDLEKNRLHNHFMDESEFSLYIDSNVQIVCSEPGMGKSVLMKSIKNRQPSTSCTMVIYPKEHFRYLQKQKYDSDAFLKYILDPTNKQCTSFDSQFLKVLLRRRKIVFIWDGLDEISNTNLVTVMNIISGLSELEFIQFIAGRSSVKKVLENKFRVLARTIRPFDEEEQNRYIKNRLELGEIDDVITKIAENVTTVRHRDIFGVPLHIFMLTELFRQNRQKYDKILDEQIFSIVDLYYYFVDEKLNVFYREKAKLDVSSDVIDRLIKSGKRDRLDNYENVSIGILFGDAKYEPTSFLEEIQENGDCFGIITGVTSENVPLFIHQSFGEYFAANYLVKNYRKIPNFEQLLFDEKVTNIRFLFDLLLAKNYPAHIAVLYKNLEVLLAHGDQLRLKDKGGRNCLHLACSWGMRYHPLTTVGVGLFNTKYVVDVSQGHLSEKDSVEYRQILEFLCQTCDPHEVDHVFGMDVFCYANRSSCLLPIILLSKMYGRQINSFDSFKNIPSVLHHSVIVDYSEIFDVILKLPYVVTKFGNNNLLHVSAIYNSSNCLKILLSNRIYMRKVNKGNRKNRSPIMLACQARNLDVIRLLLQSSVDVNACDRDQVSPLYLACLRGLMDVVQVLIEKKADVNMPCNQKFTPLSAASVGGHLEVVKYLVDLKADFDHADANGITPLTKASFCGHIEIVRFLIHVGANVNSKDQKRFTPLHRACFGGHDDVVRLLIDRQADVNVCNVDGMTPLYMACFKERYTTIQLLIEHGASVNAINDKCSHVMSAVEKGKTQLIQFLINRGADVDVACKGFRPLHLACTNGHLAMVRLLIDAQVDINAVSKHGENCLFPASRRGFVKIVQVLLDAGVDVNQVSKKGFTAIFLASLGGHVEIVRLLLEAGADPAVPNICGRNVIQAANVKKHYDIVRLLTTPRSRSTFYLNSSQV
jgi:ankyrin repeat protein